MTFEDYILLLPAPPSPLVEASMREGWIACMKQRDARIKELESAIDNELVVSHLGVFNSGDDPKVALNKLDCYAQDIGAFFAQERLKEQAAEIARLKGVIAKCGNALSKATEARIRTLRNGDPDYEGYPYKSDEEVALIDGYTLPMMEALAAIKEEGL